MWSSNSLVLSHSVLTMSVEDLEKLCEGMSLITAEGPVLCLGEDLVLAGRERMSLSLVGKVLTTKMVNRGAFTWVMKRVWHVNQGVEIEALSRNLFRFQFKCEKDRRRVMAGGPWTFDGALIVLEELSGRGMVEDMRFSHLDSWVQIHRVPMICMTEPIWRILGGMIGEVSEVDMDTLGNGTGKFMRVRVKVDVGKPLRRCLRVDVLEDGEETVMVVRYERLSIHCYRCGRDISYKHDNDGNNSILTDGNDFGKNVSSNDIEFVFKSKGQSDVGVSIGPNRYGHVQKTKAQLQVNSKKAVKSLLKPNKDSQLRLELETALVTKRGLGPQDSVGLGSELLSYSHYHIDVSVVSRSSLAWRLTRFYGNPEPEQRCHGWTLLRRLRGMSQLSWLCVGDFKEILCYEEKLGGLERSSRLIDNFIEVLDDCGLSDLGNLRVEICKQQKQLQRATTSIHPGSLSLIREIERNIDILMEKEEAYWKQRSRVEWLQCGVKNTRYFHWRASARRSRNEINGMYDMSGNWCVSYTDIKQIVVGYFSGMFKTNYPSRICMNEVLSSVQPRMSITARNMLDNLFTHAEIKKAVFDMAPTKAPEPDELSTLFYQKYWKIVRDSVVAASLRYLNDGESIQMVNDTLICLIPKVESTVRITDFRPISLCNVIYKIVAKDLANRMRIVLHEVVSNTQSAFISGHLISDKVIIGYECIHALRTRKRKKGSLALKLDMAKAYDKVEWEFVAKIMVKLGFSESWVWRIMGCVTTVTYSFLVNGKVCGSITPTRGLCQGDHMSLYLYLLVAEGLSSLIQEAVRKRSYTGFPVVAQAVIKQEGDRLAVLIGVRRVGCHERYLGVPSFAGKNKKNLFRNIKERIWSKIKRWKGKLLSVAGKEVLLKAVIQLILSYSMSLFQLPRGLLQEIQKLCNRFWWGSNDKDCHVHWVSWERLYLNKDEGGLGFRNLQIFNQALLAKQMWLLYSCPDSLASRVLRGCYFKKGTIMMAVKKVRGSYMWNSLWWGRKLLDCGSRWRIGNGSAVSIYEDRWIPRPYSFKVLSPKGREDITRVCQLKTPSGTGNVSLVSEIFVEDDSLAILSIPFSSADVKDKLCWHFTP
ncbi:hypothetical protein Dsin_000767 [Dipteronia sinensis]|uniref:Reverse transcriptase domain-containing protein n=1 Tax=Dipteronia sinensis TaxID=43782 RepID=A0AAE0B333_9ROSI|nr:hypothetical protein Dsin_000767 [Dipteronia sinensis]